jgi:pilus assembly protein CpaF
MPELLIKGVNNGEDRSVPLEDGKTLVMGRLPDGCDVPLMSAKVSRKHAQISFAKGKCVISDLGSTHGTHVNGGLISKDVTLADGDQVTIGDFLLVYSEKAKSAARNTASSGGGGKVFEKDQAFAYLDTLYTPDVMALKKRIHELILTKLKLTEMVLKQKVDDEMRGRVEQTLDTVLRELRHELPTAIPLPALKQALLDELIGYGPISPLLADDSVNEVMVNGANQVFVERRGGKMSETGVRFSDDSHLMTIIRRIVEPLGRRVDESSPMVDARLPDGSRVNAIIPPLALDGPSITIRKFSKQKLTSDDLVRFGTLTPAMADFLREAVRSRQNILISGGTGSGKTTLLNIVSQFIPLDERLVTVEDSAELKLSHRNLVRLEARPPNIEGRGKVAIRDLVINCLRMRPDRIIVGECRGAEAFDMLQAMNTGHDGSLTTIHANTPRDSLLRLENLVLMAGYELPAVAIREQIASAIDLVVQQTRLVDGARKITQISEVTGREGNVILMQDIFLFEQSGFGEGGKVIGRFKATGNVPRFIETLKLKGDLQVDLGIFKP